MYKLLRYNFSISPTRIRSKLTEFFKHIHPDVLHSAPVGIYNYQENNKIIKHESINNIKLIY